MNDPLDPTIRRSRRSPLGRTCPAWLLAAGLGWLLPCLVQAAHTDPSAEAQSLFREPVRPIPRRESVQAPRVDLGRQLFFDARLSSDGTRACAGCHPLPTIRPDGGNVDAAPPPSGRQPAPLYNLKYAYWFNWDGRYRSLATLVSEAIQAPSKLNADPDGVGRRLGQVEPYQRAFAQFYGRTPNLVDAADAIARFLETLTTPDSRFDRYLRGEASALTREEQAGYALFKAVGCASCHNGVLLGANLREKVHHAPDLIDSPQHYGDKGLYLITGDLDDLNLFRVPSLRNVAKTAPYFHDGSAPTLERAVTRMAGYLLGIDLSPDQVHRIVRFLETLTGHQEGVQP